jgi:hypothetical protein
MIYLFLILIIPFQQISSQEKIPLYIPYLNEKELSLENEPSKVNGFHRIKHTKILYVYDKNEHTIEYHNFDKHNYMISKTIYDKEHNIWSLISTSECEFGDCYK